MSNEKYLMQIDLAVLKSLGINLYSNAAAVLSEVVANAWDADAEEIRITWVDHGDQIVVQDTGRGMTLEQINKRFLTVGYQKREQEGDKSPQFNRPFMGQKGIGKLSVFSLAGQVDVYTVQNGDANGLRIRLDDLEERIRAGLPYHPTDLTPPNDLPEHGTRLVLSELKKQRADLTAAALRKRLARRFDVLRAGSQTLGPFRMYVNDAEITYADRNDLKRLQFLWEFGTKEIEDSALPNLVDRWVVADNLVDKERNWRVEGWFGTVPTPTDLTDDDDKGETFRNIIVIARKRPIQEGILDRLDFNKIFGNYVTGQIRADFLDLEGYEDIATSDRQRLIEDDPRVELLINFLTEQFSRAADRWGIERPKHKFKQLTKDYPVVQAWANSRPTYQRDAAKKLIGTIAALTLDPERESDRRELFRSGILAFERIALQQDVAELDKLADISATDLLSVLASQDSYEAQLYLEILRSRLSAIGELEKKIDSDELEKVLQTHLVKHMWLLDPSWEGAGEDLAMEKQLKTIAPEAFDPTDAQKKGLDRVDIKYRTDAGKHVIVELKRASVSTDVYDLLRQGKKYYNAVRTALRINGAPNAGVEVIFVLGKPPANTDLADASPEEFISETFAPIHGRVLYYQQLVRSAQKQYRAYEEARGPMTTLDEVLESLKPPTPAQPSTSALAPS